MRSVLHCDSALPVPLYSPPPPPPPLSRCLKYFNSPPLLLLFLLSWDRKHPWEVDARGEALLSQCPHHSGGEQEGPEERWAHAERAGQDEAGTEASEGQWSEQVGTSPVLRLWRMGAGLFTGLYLNYSCTYWQQIKLHCKTTRQPRDLQNKEEFESVVGVWKWLAEDIWVLETLQQHFDDF